MHVGICFLPHISSSGNFVLIIVVIMCFLKVIIKIIYLLCLFALVNKDFDMVYKQNCKLATCD